MTKPQAKTVASGDDGTDAAAHPSLGIRIIANIAGRYQLSSKYDTAGNRREFACRALTLSPRSILLAAPVLGRAGDRVIAHIEHLGKLTGAIAKLMDRAFVMGVECSDEERIKLASRLAWYDRYKNFDAADGRKHQRVIPKSPHSRLVLPDGSVLTCLVIDMSPSGAAVSADVDPEIGTPLAIGQVVGRVVRRFAEGFAIQFVQPQDMDALEDALIRQ